jgi:hypothetical protein
MATVTIIDTSSGIARRTKSVDYAEASFNNLQGRVKVSDILTTSKVLGPTNYPILDLADLSSQSSVQEISPFRIRFTSIGVSNFPAGSAAPIGIAIIGYNNLIL